MDDSGVFHGPCDDLRSCFVLVLCPDLGPTDLFRRLEGPRGAEGSSQCRGSGTLS